MNFELDLDSLPVEISERVKNARKSDSLGECGRAVLRCLANPMSPRLGRENAMRISAMQQRWRDQHERIWSDRLIKAAVKQLLEEYRVPIGSSRLSNNPGYFLLADVADVAEAERALAAEIRSLGRRLRVINPKSEIGRLLAGQMGIGA